MLTYEEPMKKLRVALEMGHYRNYKNQIWFLELLLILNITLLLNGLRELLPLKRFNKILIEQ